LKEGIGLRGYSGKDPVIEYKKEAFNAFDMLNQTIKADTVEKLLKVQIVDQEQAESMQNMLRAPEMDELEFHGADEASAGGGFAPAPPVRSQSATANVSGSADRGEQTPQRQKMRMTAGPPTQSDRPQNRADRRRKK
jgi:preprotein translocase subunit SecA